MSVAMPTPGDVISYAASFSARSHSPTTKVITARGELDAANSQDFVDYALENTGARECLILDLSAVEFFGTAGFSALHTLNVRCAGTNVDWALVPGRAVTRVLTICDPDSALPVCDDVDAAAAALADSAPLLKLIAEPR